MLFVDRFHKAHVSSLATVRPLAPLIHVIRPGMVASARVRLPSTPFPLSSFTEAHLASVEASLQQSKDTVSFTGASGRGQGTLGPHVLCPARKAFGAGAGNITVSPCLHPRSPLCPCPVFLVCGTCSVA